MAARRTRLCAGRELAATAHHDRLLVQGGKQIGKSLTGHTRAVNAVAVGTLRGVTIAVSSSDDATLRAWVLDSCSCNPVVDLERSCYDKARASYGYGEGQSSGYWPSGSKQRENND